MNVYFAPKGVELELRILPGTEIATVHYLLEVFYGYDLFEATTECARVHSPGEVCADVYENLSRPSALSAYMSVLARILDVSGHFLESNGEEFRRIVMLRQRYAPVVRLLQKSHSRQLRVQELAEAMNMDRSTFSKRFLQDIGLTPKEYLTQLLMRRAADLVSGTNRKLSDIAEELNFSDEYYFSRFFKKHFGRQPSVFRDMYTGRDTSLDVY
jgi:AraC-like DNA-binding protein